MPAAPEVPQAGSVERVGWPKDQAVPEGYTASIPVRDVAHAFSPADRAVVATERPRQLFLLSVPDAALGLLRHTPSVKDAWKGDDNLAQLCEAAAAQLLGAAPLPAPVPDPHPGGDDEEQEGGGGEVRGGRG